MVWKFSSTRKLPITTSGFGMETGGTPEDEQTRTKLKRRYKGSNKTV
jgi:hypothetical protein